MTSRSSIKRAREAALADTATQFGPLMRAMDISLAVPGKAVSIKYVDPVCLLCHVLECRPGMAALFQERMDAAPPSFQSPWHLIVYCDEVAPGNQLRHQNNRKLQTIYWSFRELGQRALSCENCWFVLTALKSSTVASMGGMSILWANLLPAFFGAPGLGTGVFLNPQGNARMLFAELACFVSDEVALKQTVENKGSAGTLLCMLCQNVVSESSNLASFSEGLVSSLEINTDRFVLHTDQSAHRTAQHLQEQRHILGKVAFERLQTALGYNHIPGGLLLSPLFGPKLLSAVMFDYLHVYLVHGIANTECGLLLGVLAKSDWPTGQVNNFLNSFEWPAQLRGAKPCNIFSKRESRSEPAKCSASELLNILPLLRVYILLFVAPTAVGEVQKACRSFLLLCTVMDFLCKIGRGEPVSSNDLAKAIHEHSSAFLDTWRKEHWVPKNHMALHLPLFLERHGTLHSCFVHERKHKLLKRFANQLTDTSKAFETSLLSDVLHTQLLALDDPVELPLARPCILVKPRAASKSLQRLLLELGFQDPVTTASEVAMQTGFRVRVRDVVQVHVDGALRVAEVCWHAQSGQRLLTCLNPWVHISNFMHKVCDDPVLVESHTIVSLCVWSRKGTDAIVAPR